jgi:hypothetical protein
MWVDWMLCYLVTAYPLHEISPKPDLKASEQNFRLCCRMMEEN